MPVEEEPLLIRHNEKEVSAFLTKGSSPLDYAVIMTHGAGGDMQHPQLTALAQHVARTPSWGVLRFTCKGLNIVHRTRVFSSVIAFLLQRMPHLKGIFVGGRSMGSRAAIAAVSTDTSYAEKICGIVALSYPLHTPDKSSMRDKPLMHVTQPCLFISGTKDNMADRGMMETVVGKMLCKKKVEWIEGGDHGIKVKGRKPDEVHAEICELVMSWCKERSRETGKSGRNVDEVEAGSKQDERTVEINIEETVDCRVLSRVQGYYLDILARVCGDNHKDE